MTHATLTIDGHTVSITGPDANMIATRLQPAQAPAGAFEKIKKSRVVTSREANAFLGFATGLLIASDIECIIITASREHAQAFMDRYGTTPGDARFSAPVAMVQRKDVEIVEDAEAE